MYENISHLGNNNLLNFSHFIQEAKVTFTMTSKYNIVYNSLIHDYTVKFHISKKIIGYLKVTFLSGQGECERPFNKIGIIATSVSFMFKKWPNTCSEHWIKLFPKGLIHIHNTTLYTASDSVYELHVHCVLGLGTY